jgi:hypothetical protein
MTVLVGFYIHLFTDGAGQGLKLSPLGESGGPPAPHILMMLVYPVIT